MNEKFTDWQWQIVSATLLGNGYLIAPKGAVNFYLSMSENRDEKWLLYKAAELEKIAAKAPFCETDSVWKWRSESTPILNEFAERHYTKNKKIISLITLDRLKDIGLAVWFGDKGYWFNKKKIGLRTSYYGQDNAIIKKYYNEVGIECEIVNVAKDRPNIVFSENGTIQFIKIIATQLPTFMNYKLEP